MKVDKKNARHWLLLGLQRLYTLLVIVKRPFTPTPEKPVVVLYGHQLAGNLKALYEEWKSSFQGEFDMFYLSLDPEYAEKLSADGLAVLRCDRIRDMFSLAKASAMITDHGLHAMSPLLRFTDIKFIDVWHGIPFKGFVPEEFGVQHRYDQVWVSSPLLKKLYEEKFGFPKNIVKDLGYARTDKLFRGGPIDTPVRLKLSIPNDSKIVLYAPTWQQDDQGRELFPFSQTQASFLQAVSQACETSGAVLVLRSHLNAEIAQQDFEQVYYAPMSAFPDTEALLLETNVLICDWSSIAFDFLPLNRPTLFLDVPPPFKHGFSLGKEYRFGQVVRDMDELISALAIVLKSPDRYFADYASKHQEIRQKIYSASSIGYAANKQLKQLADLVGKDQ